ncbi:MAG TPA: glycerol kinase GlpK [Gammaproteobacteria bacterium]|nr:glycerol kinase GlpK [Gammaproteobacteria bacterium]
MAKYVLALDQGTTSSRAILFDHAGRPAATEQQEFRQIFPHDGWVEHDPLDLWQTQRDVAERVLKHANVKARDIAAIGIANQRETTLLWDRRSGEPVCNAIVWQDRRTAGHCERLRAEGFDVELRARTGLVVDPYFSGTKLAWMLDNVAGARERAGRGELAFGTVDSWLVWQLTEGRRHVTDVSNASRTLLYNIHEGRWDETILERLRIPRGLLPEVRGSSEVCGETRLLGAPLPIAGIAGDQQAALFGQGCHAPGMAKNTYGTGCFVLLNTGTEPRESSRGLLTTIAWRIGRRETPRYAMEGSIFVAGALVQWLRDQLGLIGHAAEIETLAGQVGDSHGVYLVPAFVGLGAPYWDPHARGTITGLTRDASRAHLARAALEAIAFQTCDVLETMREESGITLNALRADGGASRNDLLMQIQADLLGVPVERPECTETTAMGAAQLAGLACGFWNSQDELSAVNSVERRFTPSIGADQRRAMREGWHRAVQRSLAWTGDKDS